MKKITVRDILIPTLSLFLICLVVTAILSVTNALTADRIAQNEQQSKETSMLAVCPDADSFDEIIDGVLYAATDSGGNIIGYAVSTAATGYGGQVKVMTGIDTDGVIIGVDVYNNDDETPGLGQNTSNDSFTDQYRTLSADRLIAVSKDSADGQTVDAVTSATISSRAVTAAVNEACDIYRQTIEKEGE